MERPAYLHRFRANVFLLFAMTNLNVPERRLQGRFSESDERNGFFSVRSVVRQMRRQPSGINDFGTSGMNVLPFRCNLINCIYAFELHRMLRIESGRGEVHIGVTGGTVGVRLGIGDVHVHPAGRNHGNGNCDSVARLPEGVFFVSPVPRTVPIEWSPFFVRFIDVAFAVGWVIPRQAGVDFMLAVGVAPEVNRESVQLAPFRVNPFRVDTRAAQLNGRVHARPVPVAGSRLVVIRPREVRNGLRVRLAGKKALGACLRGGLVVRLVGFRRNWRQSVSEQPPARSGVGVTVCRASPIAYRHSPMIAMGGVRQ